MIANGYALVFHQALVDQLVGLTDAIELSRGTAASNQRAAVAGKLVGELSKLMLEVIPADPTHRKYRQKRTAGNQRDHWRSVKLLRRYQLFFRYEPSARRIVYAWLRDSHSQPYRSGKGAPYQVFLRMAESRNPPKNWDGLMKGIRTLSSNAESS